MTELLGIYLSWALFLIIFLYLIFKLSRDRYYEWCAKRENGESYLNLWKPLNPWHRRRIIKSSTAATKELETVSCSQQYKKVGIKTTHRRNEDAK